jgi:bifunctional pyridoxal-dependent enzyme with beta-cystathionase and maltose regulon repressor activities
MKYDFDRICSRQNTNCAKWDTIKAIFGSQDVIPMSVADMDFPAAIPIVEAASKAELVASAKLAHRLLRQALCPVSPSK